MKQVVLLHGNCQGLWLSRALNRDQRVRSEFEVVYLPSFGEVPADHPIARPGFLSTCSCVCLQVGYGATLPPVLRSLPAHCRQVRFPMLWMKLLWPFNTRDPRNHPEPGFPYGRFPYGDRLVLNFLDEGTAPQDVPKRYLDTDVHRLVDLDRYAEICLTEMRLVDQQADVSMAPVVEDAFRSHRLFETITHPTVTILTELVERLACVLLATSPMKESTPLNRVDSIFSDMEVPLHPQIIEHFALSWATATTKYRYWSAWLTLEAYLHMYASFGSGR